jgi:predicted dithiol-disulfide oxidoreductase (DUF899 family)
VLLSEQEWPSAERERVVSEGEDIDEITTRVSDVRKKTPWVAIKGDASYKHASSIRNYR